MKKLLILKLAVIMLVHSLWGQDADMVYLKSHLQVLETELQNHLDNQEGIRKIDAIQSTNYLFQAIDMFANQCKNGPFSQYEKLSKREKAAFVALKDLVNKYTNGQIPDLDVAAYLQLFFKEHQFKTKTVLPQLHATGIYPYHKDYNAEWSIEGDFKLLSGDSSAYILIMGTNVYPTNRTDSSLLFNIPIANLVVPEPVTSLTAIDAQLVVNYTVGKASKPHNHKQQFYHYTLGLLPTEPGMVRIEKVSASEVEEVQHKRTRTFLLNGIKGDLVEKLCVPAHSGWTVVPESIELVIESSTGNKNRDWNYKKTGSGASTCYIVEVFMNTDGPSGKLEYHMKYDIAQTTESNGFNVTDEGLLWNEQRDLYYDPNWKVTYLSPDGSEIPLNSGFYQWPGIEIEIGTESLTITTQGVILP